MHIPVLAVTSRNRSTATSASFTPSAAGTYCFGAVYTPDASSNYNAGHDNMSGTVDVNECFVVTAASTAPATVTPTTTTTTTPPPKTSPSATPAIAFTGALLSQEWMIGLGALVLGASLVLVARRRRRHPKQAGQ